MRKFVINEEIISKALKQTINEMIDEDTVKKFTLIM